MTSESDGAIRLVTRADDAGNTRSANEAIREAFEAGILRNTSVMAPCPAFEHAAELLGGHDGLCIGVHVTLTSEWDHPRWGPVLPPGEVPSLVDDDGCLLPSPQALEERGADADEMAAEVRAQLARVRDAGFEVAYLDDHMNSRVVPGFEDRLLDIAESEGLIDGRTAVSRLPEVDVTAPGYPQRLLGRLNLADPGTYLVVGHPGYYDGETRHIAGGRYDRRPGEWARIMDSQRRMFLDPAVLRWCDEHGVQPISYPEI